MSKITKIAIAICTAVFFAFSCTIAVHDNSREINVNNPAPKSLLSLTSRINIIQLDESATALGEVMFVKSYTEGMFFFDDALKRIIRYDFSGHQVSVLDRVGRAKGEYIEIGTFAYFGKSNQLCLFDRATKSIKCYDADDMTFRAEIPLEYYVNAMESTEDNKLVVVREKDASYEAGILLVDINTGESQGLLDLRQDQADLMMDTCFSHAKDNSLLVCVPGYPNNIMEFSDNKLIARDSLILTPSAMDLSYWNGEYDEDKEDYLINAIEDNANIALIPTFYVAGNKSSSFWYIHGAERSYHSLPSMNLVIDDSAFSPFVSSGNTISPVGVSQSGEFISIVPTETVSEIVKKDITSEFSLLSYSF